MSEKPPNESEGADSRGSQTISDIINHPDFRWRKTRLVQWGAIGTAALSLFLIAKHENKSSLMPATSCPAPSAKATKAVDKLFGGMFDANKLPVPTQAYVDKTLSDPSWQEKVAAKKYHLTFVEQSPAIEDIAFNSQEGVTPAWAKWDKKNFGVTDQILPSINEDLQAVREYLGKYGISLQIGSKKQVDDFESPTKLDVQDEALASLSRITRGLRNIPAEYVQLSGLKKIILMKSSAYAFDYYYGPGTLYWDISGDGSADEIDKALYDGLDNEECYTTADNDPGYVALNPHKNIYGSGNHKGLTILNSIDIYRRPSDIKNGQKGLKAYEKKDYKEYCRVQEGFAAEESKEVVADTDGFASVADDKEALGGMMSLPNGNFPDLLDPARPVIRAKTEFLLARLYDQPYPGSDLGERLVRYYAGVTGRPLPVGGDVDCSKIK
ncbi:MAG TPA: hypothetical protein VFT49_01210 [Candidatus Saccharimonadales bacterium]|nr:hypothetical protein [Candidatus Saccharimonadales bacterium]